MKETLKSILVHAVRNEFWQAVVALVEGVVFEGVVVAACYAFSSPPIDSSREIYEALSASRKGRTIYVGDFNARHVGWCTTNNRAGKELLSWCGSRRMMILAPTSPSFSYSAGSSRLIPALCRTISNAPQRCRC